MLVICVLLVVVVMSAAVTAALITRLYLQYCFECALCEQVEKLRQRWRWEIHHLKEGMSYEVFVLAELPQICHTRGVAIIKFREDDDRFASALLYLTEGEHALLKQWYAEGLWPSISVRDGTLIRLE